MTDSRWVELIEALENKTSRGLIQWSEGKGPRAANQTLADSILGTKTRPRTFRADLREAIYELSGTDPFGAGPYELKIWAKKGSTHTAVAALNSRVTVAKDPRLSSRIENLYRTVDSLVVREEDMAERLLRELREL